MPKNIAKILKAAQQTSVIDQQLRVAAYCRVSTKYEEQQRSLEAKTIPIGYWSWCIPILYLSPAQISAPAISSS